MFKPVNQKTSMYMNYLYRIYGKTIQRSFTNMVVKLFFIYNKYFFLLPLLEQHTFKLTFFKENIATNTLTKIKS